jgi:hypothetical protein
MEEEEKEECRKERKRRREAGKRGREGGRKDREENWEAGRRERTMEEARGGNLEE